jgi:hypothetical protein
LLLLPLLLLLLLSRLMLMLMLMLMLQYKVEGSFGILPYRAFGYTGLGPSLAYRILNLAAAAAGLERRGEGSFGILAYGACGYTNEGGALPFPRTQVCTYPLSLLVVLRLMACFFLRLCYAHSLMTDEESEMRRSMCNSTYKQ